MTLPKPLSVFVIMHKEGRFTTGCGDWGDHSGIYSDRARAEIDRAGQDAFTVVELREVTSLERPRRTSPCHDCVDGYCTMNCGPVGR